MIIAEITGGLGNQMFQYAKGRAVAEALGVELKLDIHSYHWDSLRTYGLDVFCLDVPFADRAEIDLQQGKIEAPQSRWKRLLRPFEKKPNHGIWQEASFAFQQKDLQIPDGKYLRGYWQSPNHFEHIAPMLRKDFAFKAAPPAPVAQLLARMDDCASVALHVRRGDYVQNKSTQAFHGLCSLNYFKKGIAYMREQLENPMFFVFSDDPDWAQSSFSEEQNVEVVRLDVPDYEDLRMMQQAGHQIISNSTFSWWAAWLNSNPNKRVVAPEPWFEDPIIQNESQSLYLPSWQRLPK